MDFVLWKQFERSYRALKNNGRNGNEAYKQVITAIALWQHGEDPGLKRTKHGESRLTHVVKYDLRGYFRLVVYEHEDLRVPLFTGSHDDTEKWLDSKKGHKFHFDPDSNDISLLRVPRSDSEIEDTDESTGDQGLANGALVEWLPRDLIDRLDLPGSTMRTIKNQVLFSNIHESSTTDLIDALTFPSDEVRLVVRDALVKVARFRICRPRNLQ
ncbi:MAG TPA: hypothetical protein PK093_15960 [Phycisphaerae bacterium]|nr:hypothetical protein [Phycisphaerae bacterium]